MMSIAGRIRLGLAVSSSTAIRAARGACSTARHHRRHAEHYVEPDGYVSRWLQIVTEVADQTAERGADHEGGSDEADRQPEPDGRGAGEDFQDHDQQQVPAPSRRA